MMGIEHYEGSAVLPEPVMILVERLGGHIVVADNDRHRVVNGRNALRMEIADDGKSAVLTVRDTGSEE